MRVWIGIQKMLAMPGIFRLCVHFRDDAFPGHAGPPLPGRLEGDDGFQHRERRGVGGRFGLAGLAKDVFDFGKFPQQPVLDLQNPGGFTDGHAGHGGGHVKDVALVERRHEFLAQPAERDRSSPP